MYNEASNWITLHITRWKSGEAADNSKDGDSGNVKTNFAEMDVKSASGNMASKITSMCFVPVQVTHVETKREFSTFAMIGNCIKAASLKKLKEKASSK